VIEDVAPFAVQAGDVECLGARQRVFLADGEQQLDADRRSLDRATPGDLEQYGDRGLVVGAEDRVARALPAAVDHDRLDRAVLGHGVEMRAEQDRALRASCDPCEQVPALRAGLLRRAVLLDIDPHRREVAGDRLRAGMLRAERARDGTQARERLVQSPALDLGSGAHARQSDGVGVS